MAAATSITMKHFLSLTLEQGAIAKVGRVQKMENMETRSKNENYEMMQTVKKGEAKGGGAERQDEGERGKEERRGEGEGGRKREEKRISQNARIADDVR